MKAAATRNRMVPRNETIHDAKYSVTSICRGRFVSEPEWLGPERGFLPSLEHPPAQASKL